MRLDRISRIRDYITRKGVVSIEEICDAFDISKSTLRRDLEILEQEGCITKVYGGVKYNRNKPLVPFEARDITNIDAKVRVGKTAASFIENNDIIFIDSGTTTPNIVDFIPDDLQVTIITNSLAVLLSASQRKNITLYVLPGCYNDQTNSFCGAESGPALQRYNITKAFMAASGFTLENGATHASPWEYEIKKAAVEKAYKKYLLVDCSKLGVTTMLTYCQAIDFNAVITDRAPDEEILSKLQESGMVLVY